MVAKNHVKHFKIKNMKNWTDHIAHFLFPVLLCCSLLYLGLRKDPKSNAVYETRYKTLEYKINDPDTEPVQLLRDLAAVPDSLKDEKMLLLLNRGWDVCVLKLYSK